MPADILIYGIIAAGLVFWLRSVLGTRHGDERERPNPFTSAQPETPKRSPGGDLAGNPLTGPEAMTGTPLDKHMSIASPAVENGIAEIARADRGFDLPIFMHAAQEAFIIIVEAFAEGDRETLQPLLSEGVYSSFDKAIAERNKRGERANVEIHAIRKAEILDAVLKDKHAFITVRFTADETNVLYDKDDKPVYGNPERVTETIDVWTFGRHVKSRNPAWLLFETRDNDAGEDDHKTVPDSD